MDSDSDSDELNESTAEEFARFKVEKKLPDSENPLMWWKANEHHFPDWHCWQRPFFVYQLHQCLVRDSLAQPVTLLTKDVLRLIHKLRICSYAFETGAADIKLSIETRNSELNCLV